MPVTAPMSGSLAPLPERVNCDFEVGDAINEDVDRDDPSMVMEPVWFFGCLGAFWKVM